MGLNESVPGEVYPSCRPGSGEIAPGDCPKGCQRNSHYQGRPVSVHQKNEGVKSKPSGVLSPGQKGRSCPALNP